MDSPLETASWIERNFPNQPRLMRAAELLRGSTLTETATVPDPAPTGEVTQGDRGAADAFFDKWFPDQAWGYDAMSEAFRNHRLRSVAPLEAEIVRLREALESIRDCERPSIMNAFNREARMQERARLALSPDGDASEGGGL